MLQDILYLRIHRQQDMHNYEKPDTIPKNIAAIERPPKDEVIAIHLYRFPTQTLDQQISQ